MLTSYKAQIIAEKRIIEAFEQLGYIDGNSSYTSGMIPYFKSICLDIEKSKKRYVRYTIISTEVTGRADNSIRTREVMAAVDVFSPTLTGLDIVANIEAKFMEKGWETELDQIVTGVDDFHYSLNIYKSFSEVEI